MIIIGILELPKPSAFIYNFPRHGIHFVSIVVDFYNSLALLGENKEQIQDGTFLPPSGIGKVDCQRVGGGFRAVFKLLVKDIWAQNRYGCCSTPPTPSFMHTNTRVRTHTHTHTHGVLCEDWGRWLPMAAASWQHAIRNSRPVDQSCRHDSFAARPGSLSADAAAAPSPVSPH